MHPRPLSAEGILLRPILALLAAFTLLTVAATPLASAAEAAPAAAQYICSPGYVGQVFCAVMGLVCTLVVFLFGPDSCVD